MVEGGKAISVFCFASVRALSRYSITEIMEMGIDGMWIGYEGTRSGYDKQSGRPVSEVFTEFRDHGITILASMIVGFPYQNREIIQEELNGLLSLKPAFSQFLIYGPVPGTPFFKHVKENNLFHEYVEEKPKEYYRRATGFFSVVKHKEMTAAEIESIQRNCFDDDFRRLGPSIYRVVETWLNGYLKWKDSDIPVMRKKAQYFAKRVRRAYSAFLPGKLFGPTREVRHKIRALQKRVHRELGKPILLQKLEAVGAIGTAVWSGFAIKANLFQHPRLIRREYQGLVQ